MQAFGCDFNLAVLYVTVTHLDIVDCHLTDLALAGLLDLGSFLSCPVLSRDDLPQHLRGNLILLSLLCLSESLSQQLSGRCGNLVGITQPNSGTHLHAGSHLFEIQ